SPSQTFKLSMANIEVRNALWHAFSYLDEKKTGKVQKSKLKVFTASIGTLLGYPQAEKGLEEHRSTPYLNFDDYLYYVSQELLLFSPGSLDNKDIKKYQAQIEELCWLVCRKNLLKRDFIVFPDNCVYQLFRIFCLLGEIVKCDNCTSEVVMVADEVEHVAKTFMHALGCESWDSVDFSEIAQVLPTFRFSVLVGLLETRYAVNFEVAGLTEAIQEIFDFFVEDVIKKGYLSKKLSVVGTMRERWFVLQPSCLSYYSSRDEREKKGEISLNSKCTVQSSIDSKSHCFVITNGDKKFEYGAPDYRTKLQWITAVKLAAKQAGHKESYQRRLAQKRKMEREAILSKKMEEERTLQHNELLISRQKEELDAEKLARMAAEEKAKKELGLRSIEQKRRQELEELHKQMEKLLSEERQAKRDEELVRAAQARTLNEEWEKREELEEINSRQEQLIKIEKEKREELEEEKQKEEANLQNAQLRLRTLEQDKLLFD
ncbi:DEF6 (predicted), partial [Pycnogonum litorale]